MTKYDEQFKLKVVQEYLAHKAGYRALAYEHTLCHSMVSLYRLHGVAGLAKKQRPGKYDVEFRLSVLKCLWDNQLSYREVAALFNIRSPGCIGNWERCYHNGGIDALIPRVRGRPKKMPDTKPQPSSLPMNDETRTREDLLAEVSHLRMENAYLKKLRALVQSQQQQRATARKKRK